MTEREKREKVMIEKVLSDEQIKIANSTEEFTKLQQVGISKCYADALYDAGYRKADEVRKEMAEVFSNRIKSLILEFYGAKDLEDLAHKDRYGIISRDYIWKGLRRLEKEFGVEVEE